MNFVYALDAATGKPIPTFGTDGRVDLRENLSRNDPDPFVSLTSPAVIYKDLFIVGGRNSETLPAAPGDIRAFDVRTGKMRWAFHTIPQPGEFRLQHVAAGRVQDDRRGEQLGRDDRRRAARNRVCADGVGGV